MKYIATVKVTLEHLMYDEGTYVMHAEGVGDTERSAIMDALNSKELLNKQESHELKIVGVTASVKINLR